MADNAVRMLNFRRNLRVRPQRVIKDYNNPLEIYTAEQVRARFRFLPETILYITNILHFTLRRLTRRSSALPSLIQVLVALSFFATGSYQLVISDTLSVCKSTVCRCVRAVAVTLQARSRDFIKFPRVSQEEDVKRRFYQIAGFPNVIGCIDGCLIKIKKPTTNANEFICRKGYPAINCQFTCLPDHTFSSVVAKWPGSCHDSRIFNESRIRTYMENGDHGVLLGDSGYPIKTYLLTPFIAPENRPQQRYNSSHCRTRVRVEQAFGVLKNRFGCLLIPLRTSPERAISIIICAAVLHNIAIRCRDNFELLEDDDPDEQEATQVDPPIAAAAIRAHYVNSYFS